MLIGLEPLDVRAVVKGRSCFAKRTVKRTETKRVLWNRKSATSRCKRARKCPKTQRSHISQHDFLLLMRRDESRHVPQWQKSLAQALPSKVAILMPDCCIASQRCGTSFGRLSECTTDISNDMPIRQRRSLSFSVVFLCKRGLTVLF